MTISAGMSKTRRGVIGVGCPGKILLVTGITIRRGRCVVPFMTITAGRNCMPESQRKLAVIECSWFPPDIGRMTICACM